MHTLHGEFITRWRACVYTHNYRCWCGACSGCENHIHSPHFSHDIITNTIIYFQIFARECSYYLHCWCNRNALWFSIFLLSIQPTVPESRQYSIVMLNEWKNSFLLPFSFSRINGKRKKNIVPNRNPSRGGPLQPNSLCIAKQYFNTVAISFVREACAVHNNGAAHLTGLSLRVTLEAHAIDRFSGCRRPTVLENVVNH